MAGVRLVTPMLIAGMLGGCSLPEQGASFRSPLASERVNAAVRAARDGGPSHARDLVECLDSSDPAERLVASRALADLNRGDTLGYSHADPPARRREAVNRWKRWADEHHGAPGAGTGHDPSPGATGDAH